MDSGRHVRINTPVKLSLPHHHSFRAPLGFRMREDALKLKARHLLPRGNRIDEDLVIHRGAMYNTPMYQLNPSLARTSCPAWT